MKHCVIGMDIAKKFFQLHTVDQCTGKIEGIKLHRDEMLAFFANYPTSLVAIEACGSAHWWARQLQHQGHEVRLLAPRSVRSFVLRNKTDAADAQAIWTAIQQLDACLLAIKQADQLTILSLHRIRAQLLKFHIMQSNSYVDCFTNSESCCQKVIPNCVRSLRSPSLMLSIELLDSLRDQWARVIQLDEEIRQIELSLKQCLRASSDCQKIA